MCTMSDTVEDLSAKAASQQMGKTMPVKTRLKGYRQKLMTIKAGCGTVSMPLKGLENISRMARFRRE